MTTPSAIHDRFLYHNSFENAISTYTPPAMDMSNSRDLHNDTALQSFTATGRAISKTSSSNKGASLDGLSSADCFGANAPNSLPFRFTDESIISVPVLPPPCAENNRLNASDSDEDDNPVKGLKPKSRFSFSAFRRTSSWKKEKKPDFVMKDMTRAEYLKHYAKDDNGKYIGTEEAANDCILTAKEDIMKYRKRLAFREAMSSPHTANVFM